MTASNLTGLASAGNEIASETYSHADLTTLSPAALDFQLRQGRDYLNNAGFSVTDLATPYGRTDNQVQWHAKKFYTTIRGTEPGINTKANLDPFNLKILYITEDTPLQSLRSALQDTLAAHGWLILAYHQIANNPGGSPSSQLPDLSASQATFTQQLDLIKASGIKVMPVNSAYAMLKGKQ